jgi:hypothetical protein
MAQFHVYREKNVGRAVAEWLTAERLGLPTGPREWEQEGDGYLGRVEDTFANLRTAQSRDDQRRLHALLQRDAVRARQKYEPIAGFGHVSESLDRLGRFERAASALESKRAKTRGGQTRRASRTRPWR